MEKTFNTLLSDQILALSKMKAYTDVKLNANPNI